MKNKERLKDRRIIGTNSSVRRQLLMSVEISAKFTLFLKLLAAQF